MYGLRVPAKNGPREVDWDRFYADRLVFQSITVTLQLQMSSNLQVDKLLLPVRAEPVSMWCSKNLKADSLRLKQNKSMKL